MPIIFAQALMILPAMFFRGENTTGIAAVFADITGFWYNCVLAILIIVFTYLYTAITINPNQMLKI